MTVKVHDLENNVTWKWDEADPTPDAVRAFEAFERATARGQSVTIRHADGSMVRPSGTDFPALVADEELTILPHVAGG